MGRVSECVCMSVSVCVYECEYVCVWGVCVRECCVCISCACACVCGGRSGGMLTTLVICVLEEVV